MSTNGTLKVKAKCRLNSDSSVSLEEIIKSFHSSIREEHAWALCYQCAKFFIDNLRRNNETPSYLVSDVNHVFLQPDGNVHPNTFYVKAADDINRAVVRNQLGLINGLGCIIYNALDQGSDHVEERSISEDLEQLINEMVLHEQSIHHETDDEGIERDSGDPDDPESASRHSNHMTLHKVLERCETHLANLSKVEAESHYRAVVKALVAEAVELATFLESVASGGINSRNGDSTTDLEQLKFSDWAHFWVQVMAELRRGFNLKKVHHYNKAPIEYELTPYEILMKDIKSCRYTLRKIVVNDDIPKVNKDARAIILEFIRSRPPLKKASDRKLPPRQYTYTPREQLLHSIRKGRKLKKAKTPVSPTKTRHHRIDSSGEKSNTPKRLIKIDLTQLDDDDDDSDSSESSWQTPELVGTNLEAYDLAFEAPSRPSGRRHSLSVCSLEPNMGSQSVPQSRPCSRQSCASSDTLDAVQLPEEITRALEDNTKPWHEAVSLEDRLSLTLEEIVHIRIVLTKAELEALPVEGHVRGDVENRKVCFLCLKTRFSILGPWGHRCTLCKRTVCSKCCSKMNIPMEHYSSVPVVLLSPSIMCTPEEEYSKALNSKTSANSSPQPSPSSSRPSSSLDRFRSKTSNIGKTASMVDRLKGSQLLVCHDCRMMVAQIIKSGQVNRSAIRNKHLQNLTLNLEPVFTVK